MRQKDPVQCRTCGETPSIKHILIYCCNRAETRANLNIPEHLHEVLRPGQENIEKIIKFLKLTKLYNSIQFFVFVLTLNMKL